jgi:ribosomal-protein-alanine N-acetyltransferase
MDLIATERLKLTRVRATDAKAIFEGWSANKDNFLYLSYPFHTSIEDAEKLVVYVVSGWNEGRLFAWNIFSLETSKVVGIIRASVEKNRALLGYVVDRVHSGNGYATEAVKAVTDTLLQQHDIDRVWATCDINNKGSAKVLEKAGFDCEGILKQWIRYPMQDNRAVDNYSYAKCKVVQ